MLPAIIEPKLTKRVRFVFYRQHLIHPVLSYRAFKQIQFQVEMNNEYLKIRREIELYGHPLLTGITTV